jgi:K+-sensing histidine kinase KdpD
MQDYHLFCMATDYESPELRTLALAAQQLRQPLAKAMYGTDQLLPNANLREDPEATQHLAQVNRSLHQLLRAVCNMSDAANYTKAYNNNLQICDAISIFDEILQKAAELVGKADRTLVYNVPKQTLHCPLDEEKVERAVLNLLSNAIKFTPKGSTIHATLRSSGKYLLFTVQDGGQITPNQTQNNMFTRYLREPGIEDGRSGIGLGLSIVHSVAAVHGGTVLVEHPENGGLKITMTISLNQATDNILRSPIKLPVDYAGGHDRSLLELSDVLPDDLYLENI